MKRMSIRRVLFLFLSSVAVVAMLAFALSQVNSTTNPIARIFVQHEPFTPPAPPSGVINLVEQDTSLQALRAEGWAVYLPAYVPTGLTLRQVQKQLPDTSSTASASARANSQTIILTYAGVPEADNTPPAFIAIRQQTVLGKIEIHIESQRVITSLNINGSPAVYYDPGVQFLSPSPESMKLLVFSSGNQMFEVRGSVGLEELVEVARSLKIAGEGG